MNREPYYTRYRNLQSYVRGNTPWSTAYFRETEPRKKHVQSMSTSHGITPRGRKEENTTKYLPPCLDLRSIIAHGTVELWRKQRLREGRGGVFWQQPTTFSPENPSASHVRRHLWTNTHKQEAKIFSVVGVEAQAGHPFDCEATEDGTPFMGT